MARPKPSAGARTDAARCGQRHPAAEPGGGGRSDRPARAEGPGLPDTLDLKGRLDDPREFENIIVKVDSANGGQITRVRDVGHAELGAQTYSELFRLDGQPAAGIAISLLPEANAIAVSSEVKAKMDELAKPFPRGLEYVAPYDTTKFVKAAISELYRHPHRSCDFWCSSSSSCSCRIGARCWCRRRPCR